LSFGLDYEINFKGFSAEIEGAWHSSRKAFDQTRLSDFFTTRLSAERNGFQIVVTNVLNQDTEIYRSFRRKPVTLELNYLYRF